MRNKNFKAEDLELVGPTPPPDIPALIVGDFCHLNSGSPRLLVVDCDGGEITVAWKAKRRIREYTVPRECVRRGQ